MSSWVGCSAKVTIKAKTPPRRRLCHLYKHNSLSTDHPVLQDVVKDGRCQESFSVFYTDGLGLTPVASVTLINGSKEWVGGQVGGSFFYLCNVMQ